MTNLLPPSIPDALYRRLLSDPSLGHLRSDKGIIGFQIKDMSMVSGYLLVSMTKQTVLYYYDATKLIIFPSLEKLKERLLAIDKLDVYKCLYKDDTFQGVIVKEGMMVMLTKEYFPPYTMLDFDDSDNEATTDTQESDHHKTDIGHNYDDMAINEDYPDDITDNFYDTSVDFNEKPIDRLDVFKQEMFYGLTEIGEYVLIHFNVDQYIINNILNTMLATGLSHDERVEQTKQLFVKLIEDGDIGDYEKP